MSARTKRMFLTIAVLSVAGMVVSFVSLYHHYEKSGSSFCDFGGSLNCDIVNRSAFSEVYGIPVALIGVVGYAGLLLLSTWYRSNLIAPKALLGSALVGLAFALRLTYIEEFVLAAWCVLCLTSLGLISAVTILSGTVAIKADRGN